MATITVQYDARNTAFKHVINLILSLGGKITQVEKKSGIDEAIDDIKNGRTEKCKDFNDYLSKINS